jgi:pimeloyl-ACP methyl ester carboxylesterase
MVPGSGAADRDNDVFFPPIRDHLLGEGIAVSSFDRPGVGESSGDWRDQGFDDLAADVMACLRYLRETGLADPARLGLFGHSQGGWIVLEAAARDTEVAFVITNSGPGVSPGEQERFAAWNGMVRAGLDSATIESLLPDFDRLLAMLRAGERFEAFARLFEDPDQAGRMKTLGLALVPEDAETWGVMCRIMDHDPRPAMARLRCPVLAIFGAEDPIVPVAKSVSVYREVVGRHTTLDVEVLPGAGHRIEVDASEELAPGYLHLIDGWIRRTVSQAAAGRAS